MAYAIRICNTTPHSGEGYDRHGRLWRWDFGEYVGPIFLGKRGDPLKVQPRSERHPAWEPFNKWLNERKANTHEQGKDPGCC